MRHHELENKSKTWNQPRSSHWPMKVSLYLPLPYIYIYYLLCMCFYIMVGIKCSTLLYAAAFTTLYTTNWRPQTLVDFSSAEMWGQKVSVVMEIFTWCTRAHTHTHWLRWLIYLALMEWHKQRAAAPRRENSTSVYSVFCLQGWDCTAAQRPARCSERARPPPASRRRCTINHCAVMAAVLHASLEQLNH